MGRWLTDKEVLERVAAECKLAVAGIELRRAPHYILLHLSLGMPSFLLLEEDCFYLHLRGGGELCRGGYDSRGC